MLKGLRGIAVSFRKSRNASMSTVGFIVIGNEILSGQCQDTNTYYLSNQLPKLGLSLAKISVIRDDVQLIAKEVSEFSKAYKYVLTSGGIGPTHDDVTFEGIAEAFQDRLVYHEDLVKVVESIFHVPSCNTQSDVNCDAKYKLARIPSSATLHFGANKESQRTARYPVVSIANVFILAGIPALFQNSFQIISKSLTGTLRRSSKLFYVNLSEPKVAVVLNELVRKYESKVTFGSYPELYNNFYTVIVVTEAVSKDDLSDAEADLLKLLPDECIIDYDPNPLKDAHHKMTTSASAEMIEKVSQVFTLFDELLLQYSIENVVVSFNGGKDCTVLLHLWFAYLQKWHPEVEKMTALHVTTGTDFPEVVEFRQNTIDRYGAQLIEHSGPMKESLREFLQQHPSQFVVLMGTRKTDPSVVNASELCWTDGDWPKLLRVTPLLSWTYADVWTFLRSLSVPYCNLYDRGYTSIGSMTNTHPNPTLASKSPEGIITYKAAYCLTNAELERAGRN